MHLCAAPAREAPSAGGPRVMCMAARGTADGAARAMGCGDPARRGGGRRGRVQRRAARVSAVAAPAPPPAARRRGEEGGEASRLIRSSFEASFGPEMRGVERAWDSFERLRRGEEFCKEWPGLGEQRAGSYVEGLSAAPFPLSH